MKSNNVNEYQKLWIEYEELKVKKHLDKSSIIEIDRKLCAILNELIKNKYAGLIDRDINSKLNRNAKYFRLWIWFLNYKNRSIFYRFLYHYKSKVYKRQFVVLRENFEFEN